MSSLQRVRAYGCINLKKIKPWPDASRERALHQNGARTIVGIDEVGKGSWAGPLVIGIAMLSDDVIFGDQPAVALGGVRDCAGVGAMVAAGDSDADALALAGSAADAEAVAVAVELAVDVDDEGNAVGIEVLNPPGFSVSVTAG